MMVWDGTTKITLARNAAIIAQDTFDANAEVGAVIDCAAGWDFQAIPKHWYWNVARTAGTTDVVAFVLAGSYDNSGWDTLDTITNSDGSDGQGFTVDYTGTSAPHVGYRYYRITCTTVGAGNTITATLVLAW